MNQSNFNPLLIVISRDEVLRKDISGPLTTLKHLIASRDNIRANKLNVDVSFSGYENTREELFEILEVRNYVYTLDGEFPFWLYFLSRHFTGLQSLAYCYLLPYLTENARIETHPKQLADLIERRWGPALDSICSAAGHSELEADELLDSALKYFTSGPISPDDHSATSIRQVATDDDSDDKESISVYALEQSQKYVKVLLEKACRAAMARPDQEPYSLVMGALFLRAVLALPKAIDQFPIQLSWKIDYGDSWGMKTISIGHEAITLDTTEAFESGTGLDHETSVDWSVDEMQQAGLDELVLEDVLSSLARDMSATNCQVYFSTDYDHSFDNIANDPEPVDWHSAFTDEDE